MDFFVLCDVPIGLTCLIESIGIFGTKLQRFYDLGIAKGVFITPVFKSIFNDPTAYMVSGSIYAIRNIEARLIKVRLVKDFLESVD